MVQYTWQWKAANVKGFGASTNPKFEDGISDFIENFNTF